MSLDVAGGARRSLLHVLRVYVTSEKASLETTSSSLLRFTFVQYTTQPTTKAQKVKANRLLLREPII